MIVTPIPQPAARDLVRLINNMDGPLGELAGLAAVMLRISDAVAPVDHEAIVYVTHRLAEHVDTLDAAWRALHEAAVRELPPAT